MTIHFHIRSLLILICFYSVLPTATAGKADTLRWQFKDHGNYRFYFTETDKNQFLQIDTYIKEGISYTENYFKIPFNKKFEVYIYPDRSYLDRQWQKAWGDSSFQSECWMIASGVAFQLDILSPNVWDKQACEHDRKDSVSSRKIILHELVHVFHSQYNPDHTFSYIEKLDWFVEGLATLVSGQLNKEKKERVKRLIKQNDKLPGLDDFWKGNDKYWLSGTMVDYILTTYGKEKLNELMVATSKQQLLAKLNLSEAILLERWVEWIMD